MSIINKRFKIIKRLRSKKFYTSYLVCDITSSDYFKLNIITQQDLLENRINNFIDNINKFKIVETKNINKIYDVGFIDFIDNKISYNKECFYITEHMEFKDLIHNLSLLDYKDSMEVFIELCKSINYLHLKGMVYNKISYTNLNFIYVNNKPQLVLSDMISAKLEEFQEEENEEENIFYNNKVTSNIESIDKDIYSLGVLLLSLITREFKDLNLIKIINSLKYGRLTHEKDSTYIFLKLKQVILKMLGLKEDIYTSINEVIEDINKSLNLNYSYFRENEVSKLNFNSLELIGRERGEKVILRAYNDFKNKKSNINICLVNGEGGIGKSAFLKGIKNRFNYKEVKIYDYIKETNFKNIRNEEGFLVILRKIVADQSRQDIKNYELELEQLLPEMKREKYVKNDNGLNFKIEKFRIINRISTFLYECAKIKPMIIIIDDIHETDPFFLSIIRYIISLKSRNIFFIFSYCEENNIYIYSKNQHIIEQIKGYPVEYLKLEGLNIKDVSAMIKQIMSIHEEPLKLAEKIHEKSGGNPLFIQEIIKDLCFRKDIFVDRYGRWRETSSTREIIIPSNMEQALLNQLCKISSKERKVLNVISLFSSSISQQVLVDILNENTLNIKLLIATLKNKGIISTKLVGKKVFISFYNKLLKIIIYNRLNDEYRIKKHTEIAEYLKEEYESENKEVFTELIHHLEKSNNRSGVVKYSIENTSTTSHIKGKIDSLYYLKKSLDLYKSYETDINKIRLYMTISDVYLDYENVNKAEDYLFRALDDSLKINNYLYYMDILNSLNDIYTLKENSSNLKKTLDMMELHLDEYGNRMARLRFYYKKATYYSYISQYDESINLCKKILEESNEDDYDIKCETSNFLAFVYLENSQPYNSIEYLFKSMEYCKKANNMKVLFKVFVNLGVIYSDFFSEFDNAILYTKRAEGIATKHNLNLSRIRSKCNLAAMYMLKQEYKDSKKELDEIYDIALKNGYFNELDYYHEVNVALNLKVNKLGEAYKSYLEVYKTLKDDLLEENNRGGIQKHIILSRFNLAMGDIEKADYHAKLSMIMGKNEKSILKFDVNLTASYINITKGQRLNESINAIEKIKNRDKYLGNKLDIICTTAELLLTKGNLGELKSFLSVNYKDLQENTTNLILKTRCLFAMALCDYPLEEKVSRLKCILELSKNNGLKEIYYKAAIQLGEIHLNSNDYINATAYYFLGCQSFRELIMDVPEEYRNKYIEFHKLGDIYNVFIELKERCLSYREEREHSIKDIFKEDGFTQHVSFFRNKKLGNAIKKAYSPFYRKNIENIYDTLSLLQGDDYENLDILNRYIFYHVLASRSCIVINKDSDYKVIASTDDNTTVDSKMKTVLEEVALSKKIVLTDNKLMTIVCTPIFMSKYNDADNFIEDRRKKHKDKNILMGYIYIETDKMVDRFAKENLKECENLSKVLGIIIEKIMLKENAFYDKLTGALTRKYLEICLDEMLNISQNYDESFSVIMIDFDHFKSINDNFGHQVGDKVLSEASQIIKDNIRRKDVFGRYGGEEFMILLPHINKKDAYKISEKIRKNIENSTITGTNNKITISLGIVSYPEDGKTINELIEKADRALYMGKKNGRNISLAWNENFKNRVVDSNTLSSIAAKSFVRDEKNLFTMVEFLELVKRKESFEDKVSIFLEKTIALIGADEGVLFLVNDGAISEKFVNQFAIKDCAEEVSYNKEFIDKAITEKQGGYFIDWDYTKDYDEAMDNPNWKSIIVIPVMISENVIGVLNFSVSSITKEFNHEDYNLCSLLGTTITPIIIERSVQLNKI
ncbi:diguanylate cyclase [Hathewaya histolytica]|uniref:Diguanylate cyclase n=1 Tax=Hathewaya histolytica TaxID=1498 RepID=A0A4U9RUR3_HATHI|nr:diguanylate cyclase [Hathewaya histolytica]VTQ96254.1 diguanylate cyclase [Hathewaya histolytica]